MSHEHSEELQMLSEVSSSAAYKVIKDILNAIGLDVKFSIQLLMSFDGDTVTANMLGEGFDVESALVFHHQALHNYLPKANLN